MQRRDSQQREREATAVCDMQANPFIGALYLQLRELHRAMRPALPIAVRALQLFELLLERFELLSRFAELAFGGQPLVVGEVARGVARSAR